MARSTIETQRQDSRYKKIMRSALVLVAAEDAGFEPREGLSTPTRFPIPVPDGHADPSLSIRTRQGDDRNMYV